MQNKHVRGQPPHNPKPAKLIHSQIRTRPNANKLPVRIHYKWEYDERPVCR